jgi:hypothetical protein
LHLCSLQMDAEGLAAAPLLAVPALPAVLAHARPAALGAVEPHPAVGADRAAPAGCPLGEAFTRRTTATQLLLAGHEDVREAFTRRTTATQLLLAGHEDVRCVNIMCERVGSGCGPIRMPVAQPLSSPENPPE